jgi:hypothetical protein
VADSRPVLASLLYVPRCPSMLCKENTARACMYYLFQVTEVRASDSREQKHCTAPHRTAVLSSVRLLVDYFSLVGAGGKTSRLKGGISRSYLVKQIEGVAAASEVLWVCGLLFIILSLPKCAR